MYGHLMKNRVLKQNGKIFYVDANGVRATNRWVGNGWNRYYIGRYGLALKGSQRIKGQYYYFDPTTRLMYRNKKVVRNGNIYYYGRDGIRFNKGFKTISENGTKHTYYFTKNGKAHKGWVSAGGRRYYFYQGTGSKAGMRAESTKLTSNTGTVYVFDKNGVCVKSYKKK